MTLSARPSYESAQKGKKRDLLREIEILKKSQKITEKYQARKMACDILYEVIFNAVGLVQKKKEFYFNAPPKPVHQMIRNYKDKNGKTVWIPGSKPDRFRINIHLKQTKKDTCQGNESQLNQNVQQSNQSGLKNSSIIGKISQTIDVCINNRRTERSEESSNENESQVREKEGNSDNEGDDIEQNQDSDKVKSEEDADESRQEEDKDQKYNGHQIEENPEIPIYL